MVQNATVAPGLEGSISTEAANTATTNDNNNEDEDASTLATTQSQYCDDVLTDLFMERCKTDQQALATAKILHTLLTNAVDNNRNDPSKQRVRRTNPKFKTHVVDVPGALDVLRTAGFVDTIHEHQEWLVFQPCSSEDASLRTALLQALADWMAQLEEDGQNQNHTTTNARRRRRKPSPAKARRVDHQVARWQALQRWKDDHEYRQTTAAVKIKHAVRNDLQLQQQVKEQRAFYHAVVPYLEYVLMGMVVLVALQDPGYAFYIGLWLFVLYWMAIIFVKMCEGPGVGMVRAG